jgi:tRNA-splicing ligase RtcB
MFTIDDGTNVPVKVWLKDESKLQDTCREQAEHLARLPFLYKWACLMPDSHAGAGMPIGGVIACKDVIIPNAVGVDIGCGMNFVATNIKVSDIRDIQTGNGSMIQSIIGDIMRNVPVGKDKFKKAQESHVIDTAKENIDKYNKVEELLYLIDDAYYHVGTLGGGNHFIELQEDQDGYLCIMLHSGSRKLGAEICRHFWKVAVANKEQYGSTVPEDYHLDFLPVDSEQGQNYINWMLLAMDYAEENRDAMMKSVMESVKAKIEKFTDLEVSYSDYINCHHNYAALENHYGEDVWVHRKGAIRIMEGEKAVIPGAMGSYSYVVEGRGNIESFNSASHGAGRNYSRTEAMEKFSVEQVIVDLKEKNIILGKKKKTDVPEESRFAYKDIDEVIAEELDMITPIRKLFTVGVVKG